MERPTSSSYEEHIESLREREYPTLKDTLYLDHAGTTLYAKSLIERFSADMVTSLYGNPHSASTSSQLSTSRIEDIRQEALRFFRADPADFDLVFVANATAGIKIVMDAFRESEGGFWYGYHRDSHTSLVGVREAASRGSRCFASDQEAVEWLDAGSAQHSGDDGYGVELFAYPAQSNMNGRRLPLDWCRRLRMSGNGDRPTRYSLLDAAALVSSSPLDLSNPEAAPDFTVLSFYKIFGFPDLGALIVRKASADILNQRHYFGGGTVDMVVCLKEQWHARKSDFIHQALEDGTLPIHSIIALQHAMTLHQELYQTLEQVSSHTCNLAKKLYDGLLDLCHANGLQVCEIYKDPSSTYGDTSTQGPIVAFNLRSATGVWISNLEFEKLAAIRNIQIRTGGLCNPGGISSSLGLDPWELRENLSAGQRCGNEKDVVGAKPVGMIRVSLGAMSINSDVDTLLCFLREFFVEEAIVDVPTHEHEEIQCTKQGDFYVESVTIYPIKSCAGCKVPLGQSWEVKNEGLAWDREWCLVHRGTGEALSQKRHPRMALIRPSFDFSKGLLRIRYEGSNTNPVIQPQEIVVPLSADPSCFEARYTSGSRDQTSIVCGDRITAKTYISPSISSFFTAALGVPCHLARFPSSGAATSTRHAKAGLQWPSYGAHPPSPHIRRPILLSNESPILTISRSSLNRLNEEIKARGGKAAQADVFRANIVIAQDLGAVPGTEQPYAEDGWAMLQMGACRYQLLGRCRRCQMVCVDQRTAERNEEPFVTLAKTRRSEGRVWFGMHTCLLEGKEGCEGERVVKVGDRVTAFTDRGQEVGRG